MNEEVMSSESQQIANVQAGDREAFRGLVERYQDRIVRVCLQVLGDRGPFQDHPSQECG